MPYYLSQSTRDLNDGMTRLFDFIWPTASAFWNLRWQMQGYLLVRPNASDEELKSRFVLGSNVWGANVRRACVERTWEHYQDELGRVVLITAIASFERWTNDFVTELGLSKACDKALQFPTNGPDGIGTVISKFNSNACAELACTVYPAMCAQRRYSLAHIEHLLICYRYFKEIRNCLMHSGAQPHQGTISAWTAFQAVATPASLGVSEVPDHSPVVQGQPVRLSLRGAVGFCDILLRIATTMDYESTRSSFGETIFVRRWQSSIPLKKTLKTDRTAAAKQISSLVTRRLRLPAPQMAYDLRPLLIRHGLAS